MKRQSIIARSNCWIVRNFEEEIDTYDQFKEDSESEARKMVGDYIYKIVGTAAFRAQKAIYAEAAAHNQPTKIYATTLLLTICKKFSYGWFVASFGLAMVQYVSMTKRCIP